MMLRNCSALDNAVFAWICRHELNEVQAHNTTFATIQAQTALSNAEQFRNIIVATRSERPVRLGELAVVTELVEDNQTASWYNGSRAIILGVFRQPEANTVDVVNRIKALLPSFESQLPRGGGLERA